MKMNCAVLVLSFIAIPSLAVKIQMPSFQELQIALEGDSSVFEPAETAHRLAGREVTPHELAAEIDRAWDMYHETNYFMCHGVKIYWQIRTTKDYFRRLTLRDILKNNPDLIEEVLEELEPNK